MKKLKKKSTIKRERRYFSESFRRARVKEYEEGKASVTEISRTYQVSTVSIYRWIKRYSLHYQKSIVKVVEEKSETKKRIQLEKELAELHQFVGKQQVELSYYKKLVELAKEEYEIDLEKNSKWQS